MHTSATAPAKAWLSASSSVDVLNPFNSQGNDIEYWGAACTAEGPVAAGKEIEGRLLHPLGPRTL